jgi:hypothetical protein
VTAPRHLCFLAVCLLLAAGGGSALAQEAWERPRALADFQSLLGRSPFSLPTAEEKAAPEDRFHLAGAATMGGEQVVFVWDKNTQQRLLLRAENDNSGNSLLEFFSDPNPKNMRAKVQIAGQTAEIRFSDTVFELSQGPEPPANAAAEPNPQITAGVPGNEKPRRVIRRRVISGQPSPDNPGQ